MIAVITRLKSRKLSSVGKPTENIIKRRHSRNLIDTGSTMIIFSQLMYLAVNHEYRLSPREIPKAEPEGFPDFDWRALQKVLQATGCLKKRVISEI